MGVFSSKHKPSSHPNAPVLKNEQEALIVPVGRTIFIEGDHITSESVLMLNRKTLRNNEYEMVDGRGAYFKVKKEGLFQVSVLNEYGASNEIEVQVSNQVNIHLAHFLEAAKQYKDLSAWAGNVKIPLNASGQGIAPKGVLTGGTIVQVTGISKRDGQHHLLAVGTVSPGQKIEGVSITPYTTAKYLIDTKLRNLGENAVSNNAPDSQVLIIGSLASLIEKLQKEGQVYDLKSREIDAESTSAVRKIRKTRN